MATKKNNTEEMVQVYLFKDGGKYSEDVFVGINGKRWKIRRGESVLVPKAVAEVLKNSEAQDRATADFIKEQTESFVSERKYFNI